MLHLLHLLHSIVCVAGVVSVVGKNFYFSLTNVSSKQGIVLYNFSVFTSQAPFVLFQSGSHQHTMNIDKRLKQVLMHQY